MRYRDHVPCDVHASAAPPAVFRTSKSTTSKRVTDRKSRGPRRPREACGAHPFASKGWMVLVSKDQRDHRASARIRRASPSDDAL